MSADISGIIKSTGVALEHESLKQFGAVVGSGITGILGSVFGVSTGVQDPTGTGQNPVTQEPGVYDTTRYAAALVRPDQVAFNPKLKFLFKVSFQFDPAMREVAASMGYDLDSIAQNITFMIRHIDRPKVDYDYEEVNLYNFRTKVLKQIRHREVAFTLYDDIGNSVLSFVNIYRKLQQPLSRRQYNSNDPHGDLGMEFTTKDNNFFGGDTAMRSNLPNNAMNILQSMTIHQIFVERGAPLSSGIVKTVDFVFMNPRFTNIDIDDMDHENGSNFNLVTFTADFDAMFMDEARPFTQNTAPTFFTGDIPANGAGALNAQGGNRNPFLEILINQGTRIAGQAVSNVINKKLSTTAGGAVVAGQLGGITGLIGGATRNTLGGLLGGSQGFAPVRGPAVSDDSVAPSMIANLSSKFF